MSGEGLIDRPGAADHEAVALPISVVARTVGVTPDALRVWERRYGLRASLQSPGGHRRYSVDDVARLRRVAASIRRGVPTAEAARVALASTGTAPVPPANGDAAVHALCAAVFDLDGPRAGRLLRAHLRRHGLVATWEGLLRPVLVTAGNVWSELPHGVAAEHVLSHVVTVVVGDGGPGDVDLPPPVLLACVPDEQHDLPLVVLAAALRERDRPATLLGARTPAPAVAAAARRGGFAVVVMLAVLPELADPSVFRGLPRGLHGVAAGPGWQGRRLPRGVARVDGLTDALELITRLGRRDGQRP